MKFSPKDEFETTRHYASRLGDSHWRQRKVGYVLASQLFDPNGSYDADTESYTFEGNSVLVGMDQVSVHGQTPEDYAGVIADGHDTITVPIYRGWDEKQFVETRQYQRTAYILFTGGASSERFKIRLPLSTAKELIRQFEFVVAGVPSPPFEIEADARAPTSRAINVGLGTEPIRAIVLRPVCGVVRNAKTRHVYGVMSFQENGT